jgi:6-pyruvoyltetrahydropterin/6-carboxytetrahydropterin synthase
VESSVTAEFRFSAGHTLTDYPGKCARLHGHNYILSVQLAGDIDPKTGMIMDFHDLEKMVNPLIEDIDHVFLIWAEDPRKDALVRADPSSFYVVDFNPTAEQICMWFYRNLKELTNLDVALLLWETDNACASISA